MRSRFFIMAFIVAALSLTTAGNTNAQNTTQPYIDMNTTVQREVTPDELYLKIVISEKDYKGKKSLEEMQEAMLGALKANRIDIPECLTLNYMGSEVSYKTFSKKIKPKTQATYMLKLYDATIMQQAKAEAETLAGAIGQQVGKAISINSWMNGGEVQPRMYKSRANMVMEDAVAEGASMAAPVISIGKITYNFNVNVRFELQ